MTKSRAVYVVSGSEDGTIAVSGSVTKAMREVARYLSQNCPDFELGAVDHENARRLRAGQTAHITVYEQEGGAGVAASVELFYLL